MESVRRRSSFLVPLLALGVVTAIAVAGVLAFRGAFRSAPGVNVSLQEIRLFNCEFDPAASGTVVAPGGMVSTITIRENAKHATRRLTLSLQEGSARPSKVVYQPGQIPGKAEAVDGEMVLFDQTSKPTAQSIVVGSKGGRITITHSIERGPLRLVLTPG